MRSPDREPGRSPPPDPQPARRPPLDEVDEMSVESFPASDPPSFTPVSGSGAPEHDGGAERNEAAVRPDEDAPDRE